ncbi:NACHT, LRR and PYD domains-containing protein 1b allele 3-like [Ciona intestinalis]
MDADSGPIIQMLKNNLRSYSLGISDYITDPMQPDRLIQAVKLQMSDASVPSSSNFYDEGHYTRRQEVATTFTPPRGDVDLTEIFNHATINDGASEQPRNTVMITGQAGIGKTTVSKMIVGLLLAGRLSVPCEFIFYLRFSEISFISKKSLVKILLLHSGCEWSDFKEHENAIYQKLKASSDVVIVMDGLDESNSDRFSRDTRRCDPTVAEDVACQLKNLMSGASLPKARIVVTSRPREYQAMHYTCRPPTLYRVLGLDKAAQAGIGEQICGDMWPLVRDYIEKNPQISVICYVPVMCILVFHVLVWKFSDPRSAGNFNTMTSVLEFAIDWYIRSPHVNGAVDLRKLSLLAWNGFLERKIIFTEQDLRNAGIVERCAESFICTTSNGTQSNLRVIHCDKKSFFAHLVWQEFFAALHAVFELSVQEFEGYIRKIQHRRWQVVTRCMFGLYCKSISCRMHKLLGSISSRDLTQKRRLLVQAACALLSQASNMGKHAKLERIFLVCEWCREMCSHEVTAKIASKLPLRLTLTGDILPNDVMNLLHVVRAASNSIVINIAIKQLNLTEVHMTEEKAALLSACINNVDEIYMGNCRFTEFGLIKLAEGVERRDYPMSLSFGHNVVTDEAARALASCVKNIRRFYVHKCHLSLTGTRYIANAIKDLTSPIDDWYIHSNNNIGDAGAELVASCLHNITDEIRLDGCGVTVVGMAKIVEARNALEHKPDVYLGHIEGKGEVTLIDWDS